MLCKGPGKTRAYNFWFTESIKPTIGRILFLTAFPKNLAIPDPTGPGEPPGWPDTPTDKGGAGPIARKELPPNSAIDPDHGAKNDL